MAKASKKGVKKAPSLSHSKAASDKPQAAKKSGGISKGKAHVNITATLREAILVTPGYSFTISKARKAVLTELLSDDALTDALNRLSRTGLLAEVRPGRFELAEEHRSGKGSELQDTIRLVLRDDFGGVEIDLKTLRDGVAARDTLYTAFTIHSNATQMADVTVRGRYEENNTTYQFESA